MRLVIAQCTVDYVGRLTAHLPSARRLLLFKADGSVSVHADDRAYKPLNWMSPPCWLTEEPGDQAPVWVVENKAGEQLRITIEEIEHDSSHDLGVDPGLVKDGVEAHLQALLAEHVQLLGEGYTLVRREYMTAIGPVDLLCRDERGGSVAVEIKRRGEIDGVEQLTRYLELLNRDSVLAPVTGSVRRSADQAAGAHSGHRPRDPLPNTGLRQDARNGQRRVPAVLTCPTRLAAWLGAAHRHAGNGRRRCRRSCGGWKPGPTATSTKCARSRRPARSRPIGVPAAITKSVPAQHMWWCGRPTRTRGAHGIDDRRHWHTPCWANRATRGPTRKWSVSCPASGGRLDELDQHPAGILGVDEVDPRVRGAAPRRLVDEPHALRAESLA